MTNETIRALSIALIAVAIAAAIVALVKHRAKREKKEKAETQAEIDQAVAAGTHNADGDPFCIIEGCTAPVAKVLPRTGSGMWLDNLRIMRWLNTQTAIPWRFTVEDTPGGKECICAAHRRAADQYLHEVHARFRAQRQKLDSDQQQAIAMLEQGGLVAVLGERTAEIRASIGMGVRRSLGSISDDDDSSGGTRMLKSGES